MPAETSSPSRSTAFPLAPWTDLSEMGVVGSIRQLFRCNGRLSLRDTPAPMKIYPEQNRHSRERGSALIEFVLAFSLFWLPLFFGTLVIGFSLIRGVQVTQICRDAGHMYSYGIDFSQQSYRNLLAGIAQGYNLTSSGNGVVVLSTVTYITSTDC